MGSIQRRTLALAVWLPVVGLLVNTDVVAVLPHSAWGSAAEVLPRTEVQRIMPQGWGFFTRNPREDRSFTYRRPDGAAWRAIDTLKISSPRWLFGFNRGGRVQSIEIDGLSEAFTKDQWTACGPVGHVECLNSLPPGKAVKLLNRAPRPTLCGAVGFVKEDVLPWAWRADGERLAMPVKAILAEVTCRRP